MNQLRKSYNFEISSKICYKWVCKYLSKVWAVRCWKLLLPQSRIIADDTDSADSCMPVY